MAAPDASQGLQELLTSTLALLAQFTTSLQPTASLAPPQPIVNPPNPLLILRDAAKLLKAHTTKISLLAINKPFTPSAISKIVKEMSGTCLPAMMSAVQVCEQEKNVWGSMLGREVQARVRRAFKEVEVLLHEVKGIADANGQKTASGEREVETRNQRQRRDSSLRSAGVVWESCDALVELEKLGVAGLAVQKAEQWRDTIKDAIEELKEWAEGEDPDTEGRDALLDENDEGVDGDRESVDDIFNAANSMPGDRPELRKLVDVAEGKLKKIVLLYTALIKRRLKTYKGPQAEGKNETTSVTRLDEGSQGIRRIPHLVDELAGYFYDLDEAKVEEGIEACVQQARQVNKVMRSAWDGSNDEFSAWSEKWEQAVG